MKPIAAMTTLELATLVPTLREDLSRAHAAENLVLALDLRRALSLVSAELKVRRAPRTPQLLRS